MKVRRRSPRGAHAAAQGHILSEGDGRNPRAPAGRRAPEQGRCRGGCTYSRDYRHRGGGQEKRPGRVGPRNKTGADWLGLVDASRGLAAVCPAGLAWQPLSRGLSLEPEGSVTLRALGPRARARGGERRRPGLRANRGGWECPFGVCCCPSGNVGLPTAGDSEFRINPGGRGRQLWRPG